MDTRRAMKQFCVKLHRLIMSMHGIEKLEKKLKGTIESSFEAWQNGQRKSNVQASRHIHQHLNVHLPKVSLPCEFFQMSMMLFVNMILLKLQHHNRYFQRKPLQQQAEVGQQGSTQGMSLQGLARHRFNYHHLQVGVHLDSYSNDSELSTYLSKHFLNQLKKWQVQRPSSTLYLNQHSRVRPTSKGAIKPFRKGSRLHCRLLWHHLPQLICRG